MNDLLKKIDRLKAEIDSHRPFDAHFLKQLREYFKIGLTYSSNALEGNTLTEIETKIVIEDGITVGGKPLRDYMEAVGHGEAFDYLFELAGDKEITEKDIRDLHRLFYYRIDKENAGVYRKTQAIITGSKYKLPGPEEIPGLMEAFIKSIPDKRGELHPVELGAWVHREFVFIHPFIDGNGRLARLLMNLVLTRAGYTIALIPPILRGDYIQSLEEAHTNDRPFRKLIARAVLESQKDCLRLIE
ncbi:MAG: Fic family protein [Vulcanimicrobiota bacterium]